MFRQHIREWMSTGYKHEPIKFTAYSLSILQPWCWAKSPLYSPVKQPDDKWFGVKKSSFVGSCWVFIVHSDLCSTFLRRQNPVLSHFLVWLCALWMVRPCLMPASFPVRTSELEGDSLALPEPRTLGCCTPLSLFPAHATEIMETGGDICPPDAFYFALLEWRILAKMKSVMHQLFSGNISEVIRWKMESVGSRGLGLGWPRWCQ